MSDPTPEDGSGRPADDATLGDSNGAAPSTPGGRTRTRSGAVRRRAAGTGRGATTSPPANATGASGAGAPTGGETTPPAAGTTDAATTGATATGDGADGDDVVGAAITDDTGAATPRDTGAATGDDAADADRDEVADAATADAATADADTAVTGSGGTGTGAAPTDRETAATDAADTDGTGTDDVSPGDVWDALTPLSDDDLAALDPSALEDDLDDGALDTTTPAPSEAPPAGPASSRTAGDLTSSTILRTTTRAPQGGWRRLIHQLTGGTVTPGASRSEREREEQVKAIRTLVTHPRRITVLSRKGGVGKTTTTLMLGQTLASERGDRIVAVDGNPDAGNLGYRIDPSGPDASVTDLLNELDSVHRYADMRRFTSQTAAGLEVLRSDDDPQISTALGDQEYSAVLSLLDRFYNLVLIDTGTGILDSAVQGILDGTDQIILVVAPSLDAARSASQTLDWLTEHGFLGLVENAVAVINQTRRSTLVDVARIEDHFWDRCGATVRIPWDAYLEAGAETELEDLRPATREAYRHLAAAVARRFDT